MRARIAAEGLTDVVELVGPVTHEDLPRQYDDVFVHLNLSNTGSMDKTVMESLAAGTPVLTSNPAFAGLLADDPAMLVTDDGPEAVARQLLALHRDQAAVDGPRLRSLVVGRHDIHSYADRVLEQVALAVGDRAGR